MIKVLFICHGNICRSPMAQMILDDYIKKNNLQSQIMVESMACSSEEIGNGIYLPAKKCLMNHNIPILRHKALRFESYYYDEYDYIICMDKSNINRLNLIKEDINNKYRLLFSFKRQEKEVADPWYTRDFEKTYQELVEGINVFISYLIRYKKIKLEEN